MIGNVLFLSLLATAAVAQPTSIKGERHHTSKAIKNGAASPPTSPKSAHFGRPAAPIRRSSGLDAIGSPDSINNVLSIPILSSVSGDHSPSYSSNTDSDSLLGNLISLKERGLLDGLLDGGSDGLDLNALGRQSSSKTTTTNIIGNGNGVYDTTGRSNDDGLLGLGDLNVLGTQSENEQTTTNVAGNNNDVLLAHKRALLDLGNVNVLGNQQESTTTTTNVQGNGNNVNVNNKNSVIDNSNNSGSGSTGTRQANTYYDDSDDYECSSGSNRGRSGGQRNVKVVPTHTQRAVKQRKEAYRSRAAKKATSTWKATHRPTQNYVAAACTTDTVYSTATVTKWRQAAAAPTVTKWDTKWDTKTVTHWNTKTVTRELAAAQPTPTRSHLLDLDLGANVADIVKAGTDLKILRERE